jgi:hypothetical protein
MDGDAACRADDGNERRVPEIFFLTMLDRSATPGDAVA